MSQNLAGKLKKIFERSCDRNIYQKYEDKN